MANAGNWIFSILLLLSFSASSKEYQPINEFGENPGELTVSVLPASQINKPLVVLLHGCGQVAQTLASNSGLEVLAQRHDFSLLLPQQTNKNNVSGCFNWFSPDDQDKDKGETLSIMNAIKTAKAQHKSNEVFIVGLSAGGAMTTSLLLNYPDKFTAGAVIAGVPYPCADSLIKAISCMKSGAKQGIAYLLNSINKPNQKWPNLTVITGQADQIVNPINSQQMAAQWAQLKQLPQSEQSFKGPVKFQQWRNNNQWVELITIDNLAHGIAINPDKFQHESVAPFVLKSSFSVSEYLVEKWIK